MNHPAWRVLAVALMTAGAVIPPPGRAAAVAAEEPAMETDTLTTPAGELQITFVGHGSLIFRFAGKVIHIDPYGALADYTRLPKADLILVTHDHRDHLDPAALDAVRTPQTVVLAAPACDGKLAGAVVMTNGETRTACGVRIEAVPAYNVLHKRDNGQPFHPKGAGNGYVLTFGTARVYVAGDTESIPEMRTLRDITCAFLPMNLPYTMTPEMVAAAARAFRPRILYPYHFGDTDPARLVELLKDEPDIEVRVRRMK